MSKVAAMIGCCLVSGATLYPLALPLETGDSFPLSTYPMFSRPMPSETLALAHVLGVDRDGAATPLPPRVVGNSEVMQAEKLAGHAARDAHAATELCTAVARRVSTRPEFRDVRRVQVAVSAFDVRGYFQRERSPVAREIRADCEVPR